MNQVEKHTKKTDEILQSWESLIANIDSCKHESSRSFIGERQKVHVCTECGALRVEPSAVPYWKKPAFIAVLKHKLALDSQKNEG